MNDLKTLVTDLESDEMPQKVAALDESCEIAKTLVDTIIQCFVDSSDPFLIAERLPGAGRAIVGPLEDVFRETKDPEIKILAALVLSQLGSMLGKQVLVDAIATENDYIHLVVRQLADKRVAEAEPEIVERALKTSPVDVDLMLTLLSALRKFTSKIPNSIKAKFSAETDLPWQIRNVLNDDWNLEQQEPV